MAARPVLCDDEDSEDNVMLALIILLVGSHGKRITDMQLSSIHAQRKRAGRCRVKAGATPFCVVIEGRNEV